jgi:small GTP-binding protein
VVPVRVVADNALVIQKKIALVGAPGVGKTSLVRRFVESLFDERYLTTIGVKVDRKDVTVDGLVVRLMLWDVAGAEDGFIPTSYVRGSAGYLRVIDGTRPESVQESLDITARIERDLGSLPAVTVLNKHDLVEAWRVTPADLVPLGADQPVLHASAKTGAGVEEAFLTLARALAGL